MRFIFAFARTAPDTWRKLAKTLGRNGHNVDSWGLLCYRKRILAQAQRIRWQPISDAHSLEASLKLLVFLVSLFLSLHAWADAPMSARKGAAKDAARSLLRACSATDDVKQCLVDRGAECEAIAGKTGEEFHCVTQITLEGTKVPVRSRPPETSDTFNVTYRVYMTKKGWKGSTRSVVLVDS